MEGKARSCSLATETTDDTRDEMKRRNSSSRRDRAKEEGENQDEMRLPRSKRETWGERRADPITHVSLSLLFFPDQTLISSRVLDASQRADSRSPLHLRRHTHRQTPSHAHTVRGISLDLGGTVGRTDLPPSLAACMQAAAVARQAPQRQMQDAWKTRGYKGTRD